MAHVRLEHVKTVRSKGHTYLYFDTGETVNGKPVYKRLPEPSSPDFGTKYATMKAIRTRRSSRAALITVEQLCYAYEKGPRFQNRSRRTQDAYSIYLANIVRRFRDPKKGSWPVTQIERPHIRALLAPLGPGAQIMQLAVLRNVFSYGRKADKIPSSFAPDKDIEIDHKSSPHKPWPASLVKKALQDPSVRLAVGLLYFTGQRIERVCGMKWSDIEDNVIHVPPHKKQGDLYIPIHSELAKILANYPKSLTTIICNPDGTPLTPAALRPRLQKWTMKHGGKFNPHGLRKNAVDALFEAGCSAAMVSAITGQSLQMLEHYAQGRNNRILGQTGMKLWDRNAK
jgi:integrase